MRAEHPGAPSTRQGFTYVAPSVLDSIREGFSFQPKLRSPRRLNSSPRTPIRSVPQGRGGREISSCSGSAGTPGLSWLGLSPLWQGLAGWAPRQLGKSAHLPALVPVGEDSALVSPSAP